MYEIDYIYYSLHGGFLQQLTFCISSFNYKVGEIVVNSHVLIILFFSINHNHLTTSLLFLVTVLQVYFFVYL
jgi:hypothetical protein